MSVTPLADRGPRSTSTVVACTGSEQVTYTGAHRPCVMACCCARQVRLHHGGRRLRVQAGGAAMLWAVRGSFFSASKSRTRTHSDVEHWRSALHVWRCCCFFNSCIVCANGKHGKARGGGLTRVHQCSRRLAQLGGRGDAGPGVARGTAQSSPQAATAASELGQGAHTWAAHAPPISWRQRPECAFTRQARRARVRAAGRAVPLPRTECLHDVRGRHAECTTARHHGGRTAVFGAPILAIPRAAASPLNSNKYSHHPPQSSTPHPSSPLLLPFPALASRLHVDLLLGFVISWAGARGRAGTSTSAWAQCATPPCRRRSQQV